MPLPQICTILYFIFMLRLPAIYGGPVAKPGCPNMCGNLAISYPYGVGSNCSLDPSFTISCNTATEPPKAYLSIIDKQLIEINETYIRGLCVRCPCTQTGSLPLAATTLCCSPTELTTTAVALPFVRNTSTLKQGIAHLILLPSVLVVARPKSSEVILNL
ncbi:wall-associated receptor kinase-like 4 [Salvia splendens]|uniref:wall-associated receptor kinase-like 4 n=1 Tax=Salvia splendens TaxID=180675 RepID=UPI001C25E8AF|nr:wall-associated receptor kinase-like 4 [Salvia splendens]